jgi:hypothetical protein
MGLFGDIGDVILGAIIGGPAGALTVFTVEHGSEVVEGSIDLADKIVRIGDDVYRAIPPELLLVAGHPDLALLKHEAENELLVVGHFAGEMLLFGGVTWPITLAGGAVVFGRTILERGMIRMRGPSDEEWEMARYIFRGSLPDREDVILTNLGGANGDPFTFPMAPTGHPVMINLAGHYGNSRTQNGPLLFHELTHAWQAEREALRELFFYDARATLGGKAAYRFEPGDQWSDYNIEQQASIVEGWCKGATRKVTDNFSNGREKLAIASPLFRYVNANVRRADQDATTSDDPSVRARLREGGHHTVRAMNPPHPRIWWS